MIYGDTEGIRENILLELERLEDAEFERDQYLPDRLLNQLVRLTGLINREILVYLGRDGVVLEVAVGSLTGSAMPDLHLRRNPDRLSGFRCIHTNPAGTTRFTDADLQSLKLLRFDSLCAVGVADGRAAGISAAFLGEVEYDSLSVAVHGPVKPGRVPQEKWLHEIDMAEERVKAAIARGGVVEEAEKAILITIDELSSLDELASLADTAGALVVGRVSQKRSKPDPAMYIGSGKAEELALEIQAMGADVAMLDDELSGSQQANLEKALGVKVIDRTTLILDIFARRAQSAEGKLQVELAQMQYMLPRLVGKGTSLSRLGGGIGTRGPGETRLETDRRHIRKRIDDLSAQLAVLARQRGQRRERRKKLEKRVVALVGYTNAGKSTLLNALTGSDVLAEDKLFATLDPTSRQVSLPGGGDCVLVDTVGFIKKLPHQLVDAFRSTLEEALSADLIVVVSDVSSPTFPTQRATVFDVLNQLGASGIPVIEAFNKTDLAAPDFSILPGSAVAISAKSGMGLPLLLSSIEKRLGEGRTRAEIVIPYAMGAALSFAHDNGEIESEEYTEEGTRLILRIGTADLMRLRKMLGGNKD